MSRAPLRCPTPEPGPPEEWYKTRNFFVHTPEEQCAREEFDMSDLFEDEIPGDVPAPDEMPGLAEQSDSADEDTGDEEYRSDEEDKDSGREDADLSVSVPTNVLMSGETTAPQGECAGDNQMVPTMQITRDAHADVSVILKPPRTSGKGYRNTSLDLGLRTRLKWMKIFLWVYIDQSNDLVHNNTMMGSRWIAVSLRAASTAQRCTLCTAAARVDQGFHRRSRCTAPHQSSGLQVSNQQGRCCARDCTSPAITRQMDKGPRYCSLHLSSRSKIPPQAQKTNIPCNSKKVDGTDGLSMEKGPCRTVCRRT